MSGKVGLWAGGPKEGAGMVCLGSSQEASEGPVRTLAFRSE